MSLLRRSSHPVRAITLLLLAAVGHPQESAEWPAQDSGDRSTPAARVERFRAYLAQNPFHDAAFDGLLASLSGGAPLASFIAELERELTDAPEDDATRLLLARALSHQGRPLAALEQLDALRPGCCDPVRLALLRARCHAADDDAEAALAALRLVEVAGAELELMRKLHDLRAETLVRLGREQEAAEALQALVDASPANTLAFAELAERARELGLDAAALAHWRAALELANESVADRARALRGLAQLHTERGELEPALEAWSQVDALLGASHWMRGELNAALLELHTERGSLEAWIGELEAQLAQEPRSPALRATLVSALDAVGRSQDACAVLRGATELAPNDLALSRALFDALVELDDTHAAREEARRALLQRGEAALRADERELRIALATTFAKELEYDDAQRELELLTARAPNDVTLPERAADFWTAREAHERAAPWLERSLALESDQLTHHLALARNQSKRGLSDTAHATCQGAAALAQGDADRLSELAGLQLELGEDQAAASSLDAALALAPSSPQLLSRQARLRRRLGHVELALDALRALASHGAPGSSRERAAEEFTAYAVRHGRHSERLMRERELIEAGDAEVASFLVTAGIEHHLGNMPRALSTLRAGVQAHPGDLALRRGLVDALENSGAHQAAVTELEALCELAPRERGRLTLEFARLAGQQGDRRGMVEFLRRARKYGANDLGVLLEVAQTAEQIDLLSLAKESLARATQLAPRDASLRLRHGLMLSANFEHQLARPELVLAFRLGDDEERESAAQLLYDILEFDRELESELSRLEARATRSAPDLDSLELLIALLEIHIEHDRALTLLDALIARRPREPRLYDLRAGIRAEKLLNEEALADYETLRRLSDESDPEISLRMLEIALRDQPLERVREIAREAGAPMPAARALAEHGRFSDAAALLEEARARGELDGDGLWRLAAYWQRAALADPEQRRARLALAIQALEEHEQRIGPTERGLLELGAIRVELGNERETEAVLRRMSLLAGRSQRVETWIMEAGLETEWFTLGCEALHTTPIDEALLAELTKEALSDASAAAELMLHIAVWLDAPSMDWLVPARHDAQSWRRALIDLELALLDVQPTAAGARLEALAKRIDEEQTLNEREWLQVLRLAGHGDWVDDALTQHPASELLLAAAFALELRAGEAARAVELGLKLEARLGAPERVALAERERALAIADWGAELYERIGQPPTARLSDSERTELRDGTFTWRAHSAGRPRATLAPEELTRDLIVALRAAGLDEEADARMEQLEALAPSPVFLADALLTTRAYERTEAALRDVSRLARSHGRILRPVEIAIWSELVDRCLENGDPRRAYQLARFSTVRLWQTLLTRQDFAPAAAAAFEAELARALRAYRAAPTEATGRQLQLAGLELIEFELAEGDSERAVAACARLIEALPAVEGFLTLATQLAERNGDTESAIALHLALAESPVEGANRAVPKPTSWPGRTIEFEPDSAQIDARLDRWLGTPRFARWKRLETDAARLDLRNPLPHWLALMRLYLESDQREAAVQALQQIATLATPNPEGWANDLEAILRSVELEEHELSVRRSLHRIYGNEFKRLRDLIDALIEADELDEAITVIEAYDNQGAAKTKYARQWFSSTLRQLGVEDAK